MLIDVHHLVQCFSGCRIRHAARDGARGTGTDPWNNTSSGTLWALRTLEPDATLSLVLSSLGKFKLHRSHFIMSTTTSISNTRCCGLCLKSRLVHQRLDFIYSSRSRIHRQHGTSQSNRFRYKRIQKSWLRKRMEGKGSLEESVSTSTQIQSKV